MRTSDRWECEPRGRSLLNVNGKRAPSKEPIMLPNIPKIASLYFLAVLGLLCVFATSVVAAKHAKQRSHTGTAKQKSVLPAKQPPVISTDRTPTNKNDCLAVAQALYGQAETLAKRTKKMIPREFARVASNLDESCGEEDFNKAWISIEWMNTCLENFAKDYKLGFCSRNKRYFCAIDAKSEGCLQSQ
jgi:hypothetical protein